MSFQPLVPSFAGDDGSPSNPTPQEPASNVTSQTRKRPHNSIACDGCKKARIKCGGLPPPCPRCLSKSRVCMFDVDLDQRRKPAVRRKIEGTEHYRGLLVKLLGIIRESNDLEVQHVIDVIRCGRSTEETLDDVVEALQQLREDAPQASPAIGWLGEVHREVSVTTLSDFPQPQNAASRSAFRIFHRHKREVSSLKAIRNHDLRNGKDTFEELFDLLKKLPDKDAQSVLRRVRSGTDLVTILNQIKTGNVLLEMAIAPETRYRYDFPYRSEMPGDFISGNAYLDSVLYESVSLFSQQRAPSAEKHSITQLTRRLDSEEYQSIYLKPFHAAQVIEPWLTDAKISWWTTVCDDDMLMRDLLKSLFRCEYQFTAAFQKDLFLEDLTAQRKEFCSSLLVNIVLAYSCVCHPSFSNRVEYWNPQTLGYRFLAEAKRIWELEATSPRITTMQADIIFTVFHNLCGLDEIGNTYRTHAIATAHKLMLFDDTIDRGSSRAHRGWAFTAWTLYNWETLSAFSFMNPPLLSEPPDWPLPDPSEDGRWYGEIWLKYPMNHSLSPSSFGHVFYAKCQFRVVMNEFCRAAYSKGRRVTIDEANGYRERLGGWYKGLPEVLDSQNIVLPGHLQLHMYYHHLILTMYEPLSLTKTVHGPNPKQQVADARRYLQTLLRLYYLRHGFEAMDLFIVIPLMLVGYDCIDVINQHTSDSELETLRSTLILVALGLYNQRRNHYLAEALFRVIRGRMRPQEVTLLRSTMNVEEYDTDVKQEMAQEVRSRWPVSIVKELGDVDSHVLTNLVEAYAHLDIEASALRNDRQQAGSIRDV